MKFCELTIDEFDSFVTAEFSHYTQSRAHYEGRKALNMDVHLVGVKEGERVLAACLLNGAPSFKFFNYFYTHKGPVMDHHNKELVEFFYTHLTKYLKARKGLFVLVDPYVTRNYLDGDGQVTEALPVDDVIETLASLGYMHKGYSVGYSLDSQARYFSVLDLTDKTDADLLKEMEYKTRRNINKTIEMGVEMRDLPDDEMEKFFSLYRMAEDKHDFSLFDLDTFKRMKKIYGDNARVVMTYIDLNDYLGRLNVQLDDKRAEFEAASAELEENPDFRKLKNKKAELEKAMKQVEKKIAETEELKAADGEVLELASAIYIFNNHELYYLSSGSNPKYNKFMGAYHMQWEMIKFANQLGLKRYNFYGVSGDFNEETSPDMGVIKFKKGFNAYIDEQIGDFIKPLNKPAYKLYKLMKRK
ncbi:aminoacyltransferase [Macrococcus carouselicus]|uniref:Aminoacyltransferase FemA n=1 Tax=Macrococcus carouselicus TaxID=69969 RepID=A0A9Q8FQL5_9STAP|nr:aminoacyltransferase [Macrococcus carouselicus]TDM02130.1 aminoacyltransferase [Macrococcus carouselicus]